MNSSTPLTECFDELLNTSNSLQGVEALTRLIDITNATDALANEIGMNFKDENYNKTTALDLITKRLYAALESSEKGELDTKHFDLILKCAQERLSYIPKKHLSFKEEEEGI